MANGKIKKAIFLAVTFAVIANLLLANNASAKKFEISDKDFSKIKSGLNIIKIAANIAVSDAKLKTILNMALKGGQTGADITYGLLVLSSLNEMEFIDSVLTQKYKAEATEYFKSILDEQLSLRKYYQGVGFDIPRIISGNITSPMAALTLNAFEISSKAVQILTAMQVLNRIMIYNGLFTYFDFRKGNETHEDAWEMAKTKIGINVSATSFRRGKERTEEGKELELQFSSLYEKWAPYVEINKGIKPEFKEQVQEGFGQTIALVAETLPLAQEKQGPSFLERMKIVFAKVGSVFKKEITALNQKIQQLTSFGPAQVSQVSQVVETQKENLTKEIEKVLTQLEREVEQEVVKKDEESVSEKPPAILVESLTESRKDIPDIQDKLDIEVKLQSNLPQQEQQEQKLCERPVGVSAFRNKVIFGQIAWRGTSESANSEWFELKNISDQEINLVGWQIFDKNQQIKIIFVNQHRVLINKVFLLERTDDSSLPERKADLIYKGALNNEDEVLQIFDNNCQLQDEASSDTQLPPPPAPIFNYGVPSAPSPEPTKTKILISEAQISPLGERFVELYNPNSQIVNLTGWYLQRKTQTGDSFNSFITSTNFEGKSIGPLSYFLISSSTQADIFSSLTLTEANSLRLKNPEQEIIDEVNWDNPSAGKSWGRQWSTTSQSYNNFELQTPTPRAQNQSPGQSSGDTSTSSAVVAETETPSLLVVINEIAWAGTKAGSSDEWLELFNNSTNTIDLVGWTLKAADGSPTITFASSTGTTTIPSGGYFLLERTNASTTDVAEDYIFTGALNNDGEKLELRDRQNKLIDLLDFSSGWPAGSSSPSYISIERASAASTTFANNNLITRNGKDAQGNNVNGTPRAKNSVSKTNTEIFSWPFYYLTSEFSRFSLTYLGSPYLIQESLTLQASNTLKIEPGVVLKFKDSKEMEIKGNLEAIGGLTEAEKIVFMRSATSSPGNDRYRIIFSNSQNSKIENARFLDGGRLTFVPFYAPWGIISPVLEIATSQISLKNSQILQAFPKAVWLLNSTATIDNLEISDTKNSADFLDTVGLLVEGGSADIKNSSFKRNTIGIEVTGNASSTISGNNFQENEKPIYLFENYYYPVFSNNSVQNNQVNGISLYGTSVMTDTVWESDLPYVIENGKSVAAGATLTLKGGTVVKLRKPNESFNIWGTILTQGTLANPAIITSFFDDEYGGDTNNDGTSTLPYKGSWRDLAFNSSSTSVLDGALIRYGAGYCRWGICYGAITQLAGSSLEIKNSKLEKNVWGIVSRELDCVSALQKIKLENTAFYENDRNIYLSSGLECPSP